MFPLWYRRTLEAGNPRLVLCCLKKFHYVWVLTSRLPPNSIWLLGCQPLHLRPKSKGKWAKGTPPLTRKCWSLSGHIATPTKTGVLLLRRKGTNQQALSQTVIFMGFLDWRPLLQSRTAFSQIQGLVGAGRWIWTDPSVFPHLEAKRGDKKHVFLPEGLEEHFHRWKEEAVFYCRSHLGKLLFLNYYDKVFSNFVKEIN